MNKEVTKQVGFAIGGMVVGGVGTYFAVRAGMKAKYEAIADDEISSIKEHYREMTDSAIEKAKETYAFVHGDDEEATRIYLKRLTEVQEMVDYKDQIEELGYGDVSSEKEMEPFEDEDPPVELMTVDDVAPAIPSGRLATDEELDDLRRKLYEGVVPDTNKDDVVTYRENVDLESSVTKDPFIIAVDEFLQDEMDHEKLTITYYEEDDVLSDERNVPIPDVENTVGLRFNENFGEKSNDPNIVYIRNYRLEADFEVVLDKSSFSETVLGMKSEYNKKKPIKRMREDG